MSPVLLFVGFGILGTIWTAIWAWVLLSARHPEPQPVVESETAILQRRLLYVAAAVVIIIFGVSFRFLPYPFIRRGTNGLPQLKVKVVGQQWAWVLSRAKVPAHVPVEFDVTSSDVNHGFGLYDPQGNLIAQTQAMPGFTNHLIVTFDQPGGYDIRCLELCGTPHFIMTLPLTVTP